MIHYANLIMCEYVHMQRQAPAFIIEGHINLDIRVQCDVHVNATIPYMSWP